jgi:hypothetical protein
MTAHILFAIILLLAVDTALVHGRRRHGSAARLGPRRRSAHSLRYALYLRSPIWRARRRFWIMQAYGRCQDCGRFRRPLTIHHLTYQRLGHEQRRDVKVLCWRCHQRRHTRRAC